MALLTTARCAVVLLAAVHAVAAESSGVDEYQVKAAFLYNFAKFVKWPADAFKSPADPITICTLGNPFGSHLEEAVNGKQIDERRLVVREITDSSDAAGCQILFIAAGHKRTAEALARIKESPVLTAGEAGNFAASGGVIGFKLDGGRVRLQINVCAADHARLQISSKLLSLADLIRAEPGKGERK